MIRQTIILGATGSIGQSTLDIIKNQEGFKLKAFTFDKNVDRASDILADFPSVELVGAKSEDAARELMHYSSTDIAFGDKANISVINEYPRSLVVNALSGTSGIEPSFLALAAGSCLALANKETLVVAGELYSKLDEKTKKRVFPIDSEHSALQKLVGRHGQKDIKKLMITASGGSLRNVPLEQLPYVTIDQVLNHPTWKMGAKITVDSATMVNKAYEVIEAHILFGIPLEDIEVVQHDESIVHAGVLYDDGCYVLESGPNDMRIPISFALNKLIRKEVKNVAPLDLSNVKSLHFGKIDSNRYPLFNFVLEAYKKGGTSMAIINKADEIAIEAFLAGRISYIDIETVIKKTYNRCRISSVDSLADIIYSLQLAEQEALSVVETLSKKENL